MRVTSTMAAALEVAIVFLRLGATTFGGPLAHIAAMEDECVGRRRWLTREEFLDLAGITALLPGPNSTELAMAVGMRRAGGVGLVVAGAAFILPAMALVWLLAWSYVRAGGGVGAGVGAAVRAGDSSAFPLLLGALAGVQPVVLAVVAQAVARLGRSALRGPWLPWLGAAVLVLALLRVHELLLLAAAAAAGALLVRRVGTDATSHAAPLLIGSASATSPLVAASTAAVAAATTLSLPALGGAFLKVGATLFGSGYVLFAFLRREFIERNPVLLETQLLDAIAVAQATPGPLFTAATFVGYLLHGGAGAVVATVAIFTPAFLLVPLHRPIARAVARVPRLRGALDGVNVASLAVMTAALVLSARASAVSAFTLTLAIGATAILLLTRVPAAMLLAGGAAVGAARFLLLAP